MSAFGRVDVDRHAAVACQRLQPIDDLAHDRHEVDRRVGTAVRIEFDPRQRQQVVDQAGHAAGLLLHDREEALARLGIFARRALQGLDEAQESGQRRPQFMAGIGDEVGAHFLDPAQRREIVKCHQHEVRTRGIRLALDRHDDGLEPAVERHPLEIDDALLFALRRSTADGFEQFRHPQRKRHRLALAERRSQGAGAVIERQHAAVALERDHRIGQSGNDGPEQIVAALGNGHRLRQPVVVAADANADHGSGG